MKPPTIVRLWRLGGGWGVKVGAASQRGLQVMRQGHAIHQLVCVCAHTNCMNVLMCAYW